MESSQEKVLVSLVVKEFGADPGLVTRLLGMEPTQTWRKGDPFHGHPKARWRSTGWKVASPAEGEIGEVQLDALLTRLETHAARVRDVAQRFECYISCVEYTTHANPGLHLTGDVIRRLAALDLALDYDLYCLGPDDHEDASPEV